MKRLAIIYTLLLALAPAMSAMTITADEAVRMALQSDERIKSSENSIRQSELQKGIARTAYLPNFSGSATSAWMLPDKKMDEMAMTMKMRGMYMAGISVTQPIFAGGKILAANKLASIGKRAAEQQLDLMRTSVAADAETSYWSYVAVLAKVEMMRSYAAQVDTAWAQTKTALDAGMATATDLLRVEARQSQVHYQLQQATAGADLCRMALCTAIGVDTATDLTPADKEIPLALPSDPEEYSLDNRPEMRLLQTDIDAKRQQVAVTRADFLPSLGLSAGWSAYGNIKLNSMSPLPDGSGAVPTSQNIKGDGWNIMLSLQVPLFHWGEGVKKVRHAKIAVDNAILEKEHTGRMLDLQVRQAISNLATGQQMLVSAQKAMEQAEASLQSVARSYEYGLANLTEILDAQSQWQTSQANLIEARTQLRIYVIDYRVATATLLQAR